MSRQSLNRANINTLSSQLSALKLGNVMLGQLNQSLRKVNPSTLGTSGYTLATLHALRVPDNARGASILRATVRAGGVTGELTPVAYGTTPATTQIAVAPNGDIVVLAADAITDLDVVYASERGDVLQTYLPVVSNVLTLPTAGPWARGVVLLLEAEAVTATSAGAKIILVPGAGAPAAGQARLNVAKTTVTFAGADAVTRARVKALVVPPAAEQLQANLDETDESF